MTNFSEFHSHRWAKNFKDARARLAAQQLTGLIQGDFADPKQIFPGLKIMAPYWKAEEEMMRCRFEEMVRQFNEPGFTETPEFKESVKKYYQWFVDDIRELIKRDNLLPEIAYRDLLGIYPPAMPADWAETLKKLVQESEQANTAGQMSESLFQRWLVFCLNGIIAYNFGLIRQAVFSGLIVLKYGEDRLKETVARARDAYGWRVSRAFFLEIFPAAGISDAADLQVVGRYGMFSDQEIFSKETVPPPEKRAQEPKIKTTEFLNCQEFSIFQTIFKDMKVPAKEVGPAICLYCEEHGRKNTQLFVPPSMRPELKLVQSFGFSAQKCVFETKLYPADDMERFLKAQEKLYAQSN